MYTVLWPLAKAKANEPVKMIFTVTKLDGSSVSMDGADGELRISRGIGHPVILVLTAAAEQITFQSNQAIAEFNTSELNDGTTDAVQLAGDFFGQLRLTKEDDSLITAEGPINIGGLI